MSPTSDPRPILRAPLRDVVYERIVQLIGEGAMVPGALYREDEVAVMLGVSRPTVREALVRLETNGRIVREPRSAFRVSRLSSREAIVLDRLVISLLAVALETMRFPLDPAVSTELDRLAQRCAAPDAEPGERALAEYCAAVIRASEVPLITSVYEDRVTLLMVGHVPRGISPRDRTFVADLHRAIRAEDLVAAMAIVELARGLLREALLEDVADEVAEAEQRAAEPGSHVPRHAATPRQPIMADEVYRATRDLIVSGELAPGAPLHDEQLTERFGTSRTPVREALNRLEHERLVVVRPQRGTIVAPLTGTDVHDSIRVLCSTTAFVVREAVPLLTDADHARLEEIIAEVDEAEVDPEAAVLDGPGLTRFSAVFFERYASPTLTGLRDRSLPQVQRAFVLSKELLESAEAERRLQLRAVARFALEHNAEGAAAQVETYGSRLAELFRANMPGEWDSSVTERGQSTLFRPALTAASVAPLTAADSERASAPEEGK